MQGNFSYSSINFCTNVFIWEYTGTAKAFFTAFNQNQYPDFFPFL